VPRKSFLLSYTFPNLHLHSCQQNSIKIYHIPDIFATVFNIKLDKYAPLRIIHVCGMIINEFFQE
jgi:hypothetical protein